MATAAARDESRAKAALSGLFQKIDANANGILEVAELQRIFGEHASQFLQFCDADNNSELSCEEFCAGILNDTTDMNEADFEEQWIQRMTTTIAAAAPAAGLKFHIYDHCPFCIRAELVLGWNEISYERVVYGYGDTLGSQKGKYSTGVTLTGQKCLPVLGRPADIKGQPPLMPESGDIITWAENYAAAALPAKSGREDLTEFLASKGQFKVVQRELCRPRLIKMTNLNDWAKPEDIEYAKEKYEGDGFSYVEAEAGDEANKALMVPLLVQLDGMLLSENALTADGVLGWDDVLLLPELRTLSCVEGLEWPAKLREYVVQAHAKAKIATYFA